MAKKNDAPNNPAFTQRKPDRIRKLNANHYFEPFLKISDLLSRQEQFVESFAPRDASSGWVLHKLRLSLERTRSIARNQQMGIHNAYSEGDLSVCSCGLILTRTPTEGAHLDHRKGRDSWDIIHETGNSIPPCTKPCNCLVCDGDDPYWDSVMAAAQEKNLLARSLGLTATEQQELFLSQVSISDLSESELEILAQNKSMVTPIHDPLADPSSQVEKTSDPVDTVVTLGDERGQ